MLNTNDSMVLIDISSTITNSLQAELSLVPPGGDFNTATWVQPLLKLWTCTSVCFKDYVLQTRGLWKTLSRP